MVFLYAILLSLGLDYSIAAGQDHCKIKIEASKKMQYSVKEIVIPKACSNFSIEFSYPGKISKKVMGHNLVISKKSDMQEIIKASGQAGLKNGYLPDHPSIVAATKLLGGGESDSLEFSTKSFETKVEYAFYCTFPGHWALMNGPIILDRG